MKAHEILNIIYKDCKEWEDKGFAVTYPTNDLNEAIKELEELQSRSCKNCISLDSAIKAKESEYKKGYIQGYSDCEVKSKPLYTL